MCALNKPILEKSLSKIEKVLTTFSIPNKIFLKMDLLMCVLRAHINWTLYLIPLNKYNCTLGIINKLYFKALMISFDPSMKYP